MRNVARSLTRSDPFLEGTKGDGNPPERSTADVIGESADRVKAKGEGGAPSALAILAVITAAAASSRGIAITGTAPPAADPAGKGIAWTGAPSRGAPLTVTVSGTVNFWLPLAVTVILACSTWPGDHG